MLSLGNKLSLTTQPIYKFVNEHSVDFDGVDDRIVTDGADTVAQPTTYSFWCKSSTTTANNGVFGHGDYNIGAFHFNYDSARPLLYLENNYYVYWVENSAQDDGEWHHWVVYSDTNDITNSKLYIDGVLQNKHATVSSGSANAYTESLTIGSDEQVGGNSFEGKIDEFAVYDRELTQAEITRMFNTYYSPNRVANGNFAQIGNEEVTNGDFSQIGSELLTNGDFSSASGWSGSISVAGGQGTKTGGGLAYQSGVITSGKQYKIVVDVASLDGATNIYTGGNSSAALTVGLQTIYMTGGSSNDFLGLNNGYSTGVGTVFNSISVKEVLQDWTVSDYGGIAASASLSLDNGAVKILKTADSDWRSSFLRQTITYTSTKFYKVSFKIKDGNTTGANIYVRHDYDTGSRTIASGISLTSSFVEYTYYFQAESNSTDISFGNLSWNSAGSGEYFFVDDVTIKEVGQNWTFGTGWSTDGTKAVSDGSQTGNSWLSQSGKLTSGSTYKITFDLVVNSGQVVVDSYSSPAALTSTNSYELNVTASTTTFQFMANSTFTGSVDNIVVQELKHDATNLMLNAGDYQSANPLITSTKSMEFDGADDYLIVNNAYGSFTGSFSCWVNRDNNTGHQYLLDPRGASAGGTGYIYISSGTDNLVVSSGTKYVDGVAATVVPTDGRWHNVVVTGIALDIDEDLRFGASWSLANELDGKMTEVGLWDRTLTALEVASLYNQGVPTNLLVSRGDYVATGLQGYWKMGDGTNDEYPVIYDQTNPTLSAEYVKNGDFSNGLTDWSFTGAASGYQEYTGSGIKMYSGSVSDNQNALSTSGTLNLSGTLGKVYKMDITASDFVNGSMGFVRLNGVYDASNIISFETGTQTVYFTAYQDFTYIRFFAGSANAFITVNSISIKEVGGNPATMTNMVEGNITNQYPLTKIRNYYRMGDGIMDGYPIIQDQTSPNLAHIPTTNNAVPSEVFSSWSNQNVTVTTNTVVSPDGTQNASTLTPTAVSGVHLISTTGTNTIAMSVYAKQNGYTKFRFNSGSSGNGYTSFNLATGVIAASGGTYLFDNGIEDVGNGWFRCFMVLRGGVATNMTIAIEDASGLVSFTGDGTSGIHIWGAQSEDQLQPTTYLKSDGIAAVRKSSTTNLISYSEDFSQASQLQNVTLTANAITSPTGTSNGTKVLSSDNNSKVSYTNISFTNGTTYTLSVYCRNIDATALKLFVYNAGGGDITDDFTSQVNTTSWTRVSTTFTASQTTSSGQVQFARNLPSGESAYFWGFQLEEQTQAETYAKTTGLPVTIDLFTENNYGTMTNMSASDIVEDTP